MAKNIRFWESIERYCVRRLTPLTPLLPWTVLTFATIVIITSIWSGSESVASARSLTDVVVRAAWVGDYATAKKLWDEQTNKDLEDLVYPELVVGREIDRYTQLLEEYPGNRDIYLVLSELYQQIGDMDQSVQYLEMAQKLDPNNKMFNSQVTNSLPAQAGQILK